MTRDVNLSINGTTHIPIDLETADEILARATEKASADVENVPAAAAEVARLTGDAYMTRRSILDYLLDSAPRTSPKQRAKIRERAKKAIREARDSTTRGFVSTPPDELSRLAILREKKFDLALTRQARREVEEEELENESDDLPDYADVAALIANGVERRVPDAGGIRNDGARLSYRAAVNGLVGPPEGGKTLVAIAQACDELRIGEAS